MKKQKDILDIEPEIEDTIVFSYEGLVYGKCIGFTEAGLPKVNIYLLTKSKLDEKLQIPFYAPKTGFVVIKN